MSSPLAVALGLLLFSPLGHGGHSSMPFQACQVTAGWMPTPNKHSMDSCHRCYAWPRIPGTLGMHRLYWFPVSLVQIYVLGIKHSRSELLVAWEPTIAFHCKIFSNSAISLRNIAAGTFSKHLGGGGGEGASAFLFSIAVEAILPFTVWSL